MKSGLHLVIGLIGSMLLAGCAKTSQPPAVSPPMLVPSKGPSSTYVNSRVYPVAPFNQVFFSGDMNITVNGNQPNTQLRVFENSPSQTAITTYTKNGVLYVKYPYTGSDPTPIEVELDLANDISKISYYGNGQLNANNIGYSNLTVALSGKSKMILSGNLVLQTIAVHDNATLYAYWLNTSNLQVYTEDNAKVFLGGVVRNLNVVASGNSDVDAKYLRADNAFIKTTDTADVGVNIKHSMSNWSTDSSTVYYYKDSNFGTSYLASSGSALRMVGIPTS